MDKVVQQNAANAEESASSSEEMNAQAEQMKASVGELMALIEGSEKHGQQFTANSTKFLAGHSDPDIDSASSTFN